MHSPLSPITPFSALLRCPGGSCACVRAMGGCSAPAAALSERALDFGLYQRRRRCRPHRHAPWVPGLWVLLPPSNPPRVSLPARSYFKAEMLPFGDQEPGEGQEVGGMLGAAVPPTTCCLASNQHCAAAPASCRCSAHLPGPASAPPYLPADAPDAAALLDYYTHKGEVFWTLNVTGVEGMRAAKIVFGNPEVFGDEGERAAALGWWGALVRYSPIHVPAARLPAVVLPTLPH